MDHAHTDTRLAVRSLAAPAPGVESWTHVDDGIAVNDVIDQASAPEAAMTVGFARLDRGATLDISFPYDEVLIVTRGRYTVRTEDGVEVTAGPGEGIYLPARSQNWSHAVEDTEIAYVAAPPSVYAAHVAASTAG